MSLAFGGSYDAVIVGAGAAGLFCAGIAGQRGLKVLVLDHAAILGEKIRISGGGRCNFTNQHSDIQNFLCLDPHFPRRILQGYRPRDFIQLVRAHRIGFHEKHKGQLFCDRSSQQITSMLRDEADKGHVRLAHPVKVLRIFRSGTDWQLLTDQGSVTTPQVVLATGGLPVPAIGASGFALDIARDLGIPVTPIQPALVPLALTSDETRFLTQLAGLSLPVQIRVGPERNSPTQACPQDYGGAQFDEDLLFTHKGLSGPAVLQASSYWQPGEDLVIDLLAGQDPQQLLDERRYGSRSPVVMLAEHVPERLAQALVAQAALPPVRWAEQGRGSRQRLFGLLRSLRVRPAGSLGWNKAEVMRGGVATNNLDSRTLESRTQRGLFFIGECVDVTGHLGGHNFQWAWASGYACGQALRLSGPKRA